MNAINKTKSITAALGAAVAALAAPAMLMLGSGSAGCDHAQHRE